MNQPAINQSHIDYSPKLRNWTLGLFIARVSVVFAAYFVTGGQEIADDVGFHLEYINTPLCLVSGDTTAPFPHSPPLLPMALWLFNAPLLAAGLPSFLALRLSSIAWESLAFVTFFAGLRPEFAAKKEWMRASLLAWIFSPMCVMTTAVMAQDESIAMFICASAVALTYRYRFIAAAFVIGIGVVTAKIFFLVLAGAWTFGTCRSFKAILWRGTALALPIAVVYTWSIAMWQTSGTNPFHADFLLVNSTSVWGLLANRDISMSTIKASSQLLALSFGLIPLAMSLVQRRDNDSLGISLLGASMLSWVLFWYYQVQPEYLLMLIPLILAVCSRRLPIYAITIGVLSLPWAVNVAYSLWISATGDSFKSRVAQQIESFTPIEMPTIHTGFLIVNSIAIAIVCIYLTYSFWKYEHDC